jgi:hypothetical protein
MSHDGPQRHKKKEICLVLINCHCSSIYMALQLTAILTPLVSGHLILFVNI